MGAQTTVIVVLLAGQGAFAASFQMGGDFFTRALARLRNCSQESAEALKRSKDILNGASADPEFRAVVDGWAAELKRQLHEWFQHNPGLEAEASSFEMVASGGAFDQPGLLEYLNAQKGLKLRPWPRNRQPKAVMPAKGFEVAFGTALQALGQTAQPVSLLPDDYRRAWQKRVARQKLELASLALLLAEQGKTVEARDTLETTCRAWPESSTGHDVTVARKALADLVAVQVAPTG